VEQNSLTFHKEFLHRYLSVAPAALAVERSMECNILASKQFARPVLDVGCGDGVFASILFNDKIDTGIDFDADEIRRAMAFGAYGELVVCGGDAIPKPDGSFRTIFSNSVLEHIPDLLPVVREVHRLLAVGGYFYVTIPTDRWEAAVWPARLLSAFGLKGMAVRYGRFYNTFWKHFHALPILMWIELFESAGFKVDEIRTYSPANMTTLLDVLTPFAAPSMFTKRVMGRWILVPAFRSLVVRMLEPILCALTGRFNRAESGALVFFSLTK
jgi:SAM-dependent methyltransferase